MDVQLLIDTLTEGLPAEQAAVVKAAIEREAVKTKAAGWKQQNEYDAIQQRASELQAALEGSEGKPGAKTYQEWYQNNYQAISDLQKRAKAYEDKYGSLENPTTNSQQGQAPPVKQYSQEDIDKLVDARIQSTYVPAWSKTILAQNKIMQKHLLNKRTAEVDLDALAKMANDKYQGNLEMAYDEWDKPEREKEQKAKQDAEVERRVKERLQQERAKVTFPGQSANEPSGALASRTKEETKGFDRNALNRELAATYMGASEDTVQ